ncbi:acyltransferase family protein [Alloscardovia venturai]|uniref:Acyltransferase family protein n=1 Tax=Alloscardovia venturai TaxID=1769421 RepID=A0ABW2Y4M6_9BIFI
MTSHSKHRNVSIEILRIIAMFLVLACHGILHLNWMLHVDSGLTPHPGWETALSYLVVQYGQVGVCIFFMISGYFLVKKSFNWKRIITPWAHVLVYTIGFFIIALLLPAAIKQFAGINVLFDTRAHIVETLVAVFTPISASSYWFMTSYIAMLILSPYINTLFEHVSEHAMIGLIGFISLLSVLMLYWGRTNLFNHIFYACLCYMIGGWMRVYLPAHRTWNRVQIFGAIIVATVAMALFNFAAASQNSIINALTWNAQLKDGIWLGPVIVAACLFLCAVKKQSPSRHTTFESAIIAISPATFGVYLLHENLFGYRLLWRTWEYLVPAPHTILTKVAAYLAILVVTYAVLLLAAYVMDRFIANPISRFVGTKLAAVIKK